MRTSNTNGTLENAQAERNLYYGARYLDPSNAMWLSVDPLWEKYVGMSPYQYCAGNPVKLVDTDGRHIRIAYVENGVNRTFTYIIGRKCDVQNEYVQKTVAALNHLCKHEGSRKIIKKLTDPSVSVSVLIKNTNKYPRTEALSKTKATIYFNPSIGATLVDDSKYSVPYGTQSPAMLLALEIDHVSDAMDDYDMFVENSKPGSDTKYHTISDRRTITGLETDAATYFGECTRDNHWVGESFFTNDPTSNIPTLDLDNKTVVKESEIKLNIKNVEF